MNEMFLNDYYVQRLFKQTHLEYARACVWMLFIFHDEIYVTLATTALQTRAYVRMLI